MAILAPAGLWLAAEIEGWRPTPQRSLRRAVPRAPQRAGATSLPVPRGSCVGSHKIDHNTLASPALRPVAIAER